MNLNNTLGTATLLAFLVLGPGAPARADGADYTDLGKRGPFPVGVRTVVLEDASRDDNFAGGKRTLVTEIWYPTTEAFRDRPKTTFAEFFDPYREEGAKVLKTEFSEIEPRFRSLGVRNAPLQENGVQHPLLIFSHGNGGFRHQNVFQVDHLASHGYIVASADHTGNARLAPLPSGAVGYNRDGRGQAAEDRPRDVRFLIDWFLRQSRDGASWLHGRIDSERIGVLGHSFGGYTACRAAIDDPRVKAIIPMTVALAGTDAGPAKVPTMVFLGKHDRTIRAVGNFASRGYYSGCKAEKYLVTFNRGGHFTFCDMAVLDPNHGDGIGRGKGLDGIEMDFIPVPLAKEIINSYTLAFFDRYLRQSDRAAAFLSRNHYTEDMEYLQENIKPARVLIITGEDVPAHKWRETTPVTRELLAAEESLDIRVCEDIGILETASINRYDVLVFNFRNNYKVRDVSEAGRANLLRYLEAGKGLVAIHFAVAAMQNWPGYRDIVGRVWVRKKSGHGPRGPFRAKISSSEHAITNGLEDFDIDDELYARLEGDAPVTVLVEAHSDWSEKTEPLVWTLTRDTGDDRSNSTGGGRIVCITLGHDARARRNPAFETLLRRSTEWAARGFVPDQ